MDCKATAAQVESLKATLHAAVDTMLERLLAELEEGEPTLEGVERSVLRELHTLGNVTLSGVCSALVPRYAPAEVAACACGGRARYQRRREAQCKTLLGVIHLMRPYYLCPACHAGHCPLDRSLGFCAGSVSGGLEALLALLGSEFSYGHAAAMVERLSLVQVSASRCRQATNALGALVTEHEESVRQAVWKQGQEPPQPAAAPLCGLPCDPLYVSADGVMIHTRENGWREQCVGAVYTAAPPVRTREDAGSVRSRAHSYVSELGSRQAFSDLLWLEAQRRGLEQTQTVVFIGDGAQWLWHTAQDLFPTAVQILDWYHVTTYIWQAAQALYPHDETTRSHWAETQLDALWQSHTTEVMATLQPLAPGCTAAREALSYLTTNQTRMDYARYRALGLQVGSGTIESACKHVIQARLKQAGMRWCLPNARTLGKLRTRHKSDRWEETLALRPPRHRTYHPHSTT